MNVAEKAKEVITVDATMRTPYATDAFVYREMPQTIVLPKTEDDICKLVPLAPERSTLLISRTAGACLPAGNQPDP